MIETYLVNASRVLDAQKSIGIPSSVLTQKLGITQVEYDNLISKGLNLPLKKIKELAKIYRVHWLYLVSKNKPADLIGKQKLRNLSDRSFIDSPELKLQFKVTNDTLESIFSNDLRSTDLRLAELQNIVTEISDPEEVALTLRNLLKISLSDIKKLSKPKEVLRYWKNIIESELAIYILEQPLVFESIKGYTMKRGAHVVIVLNESDYDFSKVFTLFHEIYHILLDSTGVIDIEKNFLKPNSSEERKCNEFAAAFLIPRDQLSIDITYEAVSSIFRVSKIAALIRLKTLSAITDRTYFAEIRKLKIKFAEVKNAIEKRKLLNKGKSFPISRIARVTKIVRNKGNLLSSQVMNLFNENKVANSTVTSILDTKYTYLPIIQSVLNGSQ